MFEDIFSRDADQIILICLVICAFPLLFSIIVVTTSVFLSQLSHEKLIDNYRSSSAKQKYNCGRFTNPPGL